METQQVNGYTLTVDYDEYPLNPMRDGDTLGIMVARHNRYDLGSTDSVAERYHNVINELAERIPSRKRATRAFELWLKVYEGATVVLPLTVYEHGGITMHIGDNRGWDSSFVGFIFDTNETRKNTGVAPGSVEQFLRGEVREYASYLEGDVGRFTITDDEGECVRSCGSFFPRGDLDALEVAMREAVAEAECLPPLTAKGVLNKRIARLENELAQARQELGVLR